MKKLIILLTTLALGFAGYAQCTVNSVTETILVNGVAGGSPVCSGKQVSTKITNLQDGVTYTITYPGFTQSKQYWVDGNFTSITWSLGTLTQAITYTITGKADGCTQTTTIISNTINVVSTSPTVTLTPSTDPSQVCANSSITLTASGTAGLTYTWHADRQIDIQSFNQGQYHATSFSPSQPAIYWVTATESQCGTSAESQHIGVNFIPAVSTPILSSSSGPHCKGSGTTTYTAAANNATSYTWSMTGGGSSTISSAGVITWDPNFAGTAQITVTAYGCGGSTAYAQTSVTSNTIASATLTGGGATCSGAVLPLTLTANAGNLDDVWYSLYLNGTFVSQQEGWSNRNQTDNPVSSISWNQANPGLYTVTATGNGCTNIPMAGSATISIKQPGTLTLTPSSDPTKVCSGDPFTLTASGGSSYTWHSNVSQPDINGFDQGNVHGNAFSPYRSATYWVTGTESICGTSTLSDNIGVTINPLPDGTINPVGNVKICSLCTQSINAVNNAGNTYQWRKDGMPIAGATSSSFTASQSGAYSVYIVSGTGCSITSGNLQLAINIPPSLTLSSQTLTLPTNSTTLVANASDADGSIVSYLWTQMSGAVATISGELTSSLAVSDLHVGTYQFQVSVTDDFGEMKNVTATVQVNAPFNNFNYVKESSILVGGKIQSADIVGLPVEQKNISTTYFDGLGRAVQTVSTQASPNSKTDIVTPVNYDEYGREPRKYLPYVATSTDGSFKLTGVADQGAFYTSPPSKIASDIRPFSETIFEASPLNRPMQDFGPGAAWNNVSNQNPVTHQYPNNQASEVFLFTYDASTGLVSLGSGAAGYYGPGQLSVKKTIDEQKHEVIEYADKLGHTVCKKVQSGGTDSQGNKLYASTYYVYDDLGNLVIVLPPEAIHSALGAINQH